MKKYVVQTRHGCEEFVSLAYARMHAHLNAPASIWNAADVKEIQASGVTVAIGTFPLEMHPPVGRRHDRA